MRSRRVLGLPLAAWHARLVCAADYREEYLSYQVGRIPMLVATDASGNERASSTYTDTVCCSAEYSAVHNLASKCFLISNSTILLCTNDIGGTRNTNDLKVKLLPSCQHDTTVQ